MKYSKTFEYISAVSYESSTYYTEQKKQRAGFLIKEILDRFTNKTLSLLKPDRSLWIYAIHSTGMVNLLNSLNVFDVCPRYCFSLSRIPYHIHILYFMLFQFLIPPFSSSILFELYKRADEYYVQVIYRKTVSGDHKPLYIPNCGVKCPLAKFYEVYQNILPTANETFNSLCISEQ